MSHIDHFVIICTACETLAREVALRNDDSAGKGDANWRQADAQRPSACAACGTPLRTEAQRLVARASGQGEELP